MTNADRIRMMTDEELTKIIMCPYDTFGESVDIMPCIRDGKVQVSVSPQFCYECMRKWLLAESEEEPKSAIPESVKESMEFVPVERVTQVLDVALVR